MAAFHEPHEVASHRVTVYDKTGLRYAGDSLVSTDLLGKPIKGHTWNDSLKLSWE